MKTDELRKELQDWCNALIAGGALGKVVFTPEDAWNLANSIEEALKRLPEVEA